MSEGSITQWFGGLQAGENEAVAVICERYFDQLVAYARRHLQSVPRRTADEEDVALSALNCFAAKAADGKFSDLRDRTELWKLLLTITVRKASDARKRQSAQKRGGGQVRGESIFRSSEDENAAGLEAFVGDDLSPASIVQLNEKIVRMMEALPDESLRLVASLRLQAYSIEEIAEQLPSTKRTVIRKLNRVRDKWSELLESEGE